MNPENIPRVAARAPPRRLAHEGNDGLSIPVIVRTSQRVAVVFHAGRAPDDAVDINPGWINDGQ
jgi:hypothetical protein